MPPDAVVIGAGPNGLSAAIALARTGRSVAVLEANATIGGGCRSAELTLPGFVHDVCSAFHPMGASAVRIRFTSVNGANGSMNLAIHDPTLVLTAVRKS